MTMQILSDSETSRKSYAKEVGNFLENGLVTAHIPQGQPSVGLAGNRQDQAVGVAENAPEVAGSPSGATSGVSGSSASLMPPAAENTATASFSAEMASAPAGNGAAVSNQPDNPG